MESDPSSKLSTLSPKSIDRLCYELLELRRRFQGGAKISVPLVSLGSSSGRTYRGWLIAYGSENVASPVTGSEPYAVIHLWPEGLSNPTEDVAYLPLSQIESLTVHSAAVFADALTPPLSRMDVSRRVYEITEIIRNEVGVLIPCHVEWDKLPNSEHRYDDLGRLCGAFKKALNPLIADALGRQWLTDSIQEIVFEIGSETTVSLERGRLLVRAYLGYASNPLSNALEEAMNSLVG